MTQLPILIIIIPLLFVPIFLLMRARDSLYFASLFIAIGNLLLTLLLFYNVYYFGPLLYELGNWESPIGIRLNADLLSCYFLLLINFISFICILSGRKLIESEVHNENIYLFYISWILCNVGFIGIILTNDIFNLFVFLEISSLSSYFLISQGKHKQSMLAALQYLFVGSIAAVFLLLAIGIIYTHTGTLNMSDISSKIIGSQISSSVILAISLFLIGIGIKSAIFPLHGWLIKAYAYSPSIIVTYFSGTSTKIGIYILIRVFLDIFNSLNPFDYYHLTQFILTLSIAGVLLSTIYAIKQDEIRKMLAYSSVAQLSYIIIAIMIMTPDGLSAALVHVFNHSIIKTGLFLIIAVLFVDNHKVCIKDLSGLGGKYPMLMTCFVILSLGLIGIPLTSGFISKWYLIHSIINSNYWYISIIVLVTSFMTLFYIWRLFESIYFSKEKISTNSTVDRSQALGIVLLAILTLYLGLDATLTAGVSKDISINLLGGVTE